ncbi:hypothetical protein V1524DRAFT_238953 [Lipomyces starkeyi]
MFSVNQISGVILSTTYATAFLPQLGISNPFQLTIAASCCTLAGTIAAPLIMDRVGRRPIALVGMSTLLIIDFDCQRSCFQTCWKLDQQWVKNNRDPNHTVFSIALWDQEKSQFAAANELLSLSLLNSFGFNSPEEIFEQRIPDGQDELPLRWREEAHQWSGVLLGTLPVMWLQKIHLQRSDSPCFFGK